MRRPPRIFWQMRGTSNAADYCPNTFFTSPTLRCILPPAFSAVPRSRKFGLPMALPVSSFTFPFASLIPPWILSFVLDFINKESEPTRTTAVGCDFRLPHGRRCLGASRMNCVRIGHLVDKESSRSHRLETRLLLKLSRKYQLPVGTDYGLQRSYLHLSCLA
jgi:hypothetical protein